MTIISKTAATLSIGSALADIHKTAACYANQEQAKTSANTVISKSLSSQKSDTFSAKDAARKNWLAQKNFLAGPQELYGKIKGYLKGVCQSAPRYIPNFILGIIGLTAKSPTMAKISTVGLAVVELYDFLTNSVNIGQKNDQLKL